MPSEEKIYTTLLESGVECRYIIRNSRRAKRMSIQVARQGQVEVVKPLRFSMKNAHEAIHYKQQWLSQLLLNISKQGVVEEKPTVLNLRMINQRIDIDYISVNSKTLSGKWLDGEHLLIEGDASDFSQLNSVLADFLKFLGKEHLTALLEQTSEECGLDYNRVTIRTQKTRWGSCSTKKNINLNAKLLLFPPEIARYVCVHELCHTLEMNHSAHFWAHVESFDKDYRQHRAILKHRALEFMPYGF